MTVTSCWQRESLTHVAIPVHLNDSTVRLAAVPLKLAAVPRKMLVEKNKTKTRIDEQFADLKRPVQKRSVRKKTCLRN